MYREIGSEFNKTKIENGKGMSYPFSPTFTFSGRTAIETVLKDMPYVKKAMLPSYCCDSMLEPFRKAGIELYFYGVNFEDKLNFEVDIPDDVDVFLWCNYFGFKNSIPDIDGFLKRGGVIVEDITHSLFSYQQYHSESAYLVASLRKWEPIYCGGYCAKVNAELKQRPIKNPPEEFINLKDSAMKLKTEYLSDLEKYKKTIFLKEFNESNRWLEDNYSGLSIDQYSKAYLSSVDAEKQKKIRRENAKVLYQRLGGKVQFLFSEEKMDCPLFVPIILKERRDEIRKRLIENEIYCPVHWPHPNMECGSNLYDIELSLVCDQRYTREDMEREAEVLLSLL